jgi:hypothetical protein
MLLGTGEGPAGERTRTSSQLNIMCIIGALMNKVVSGDDHDRMGGFGIALLDEPCGTFMTNSTEPIWNLYQLPSKVALPER